MRRVIVWDCVIVNSVRYVFYWNWSAMHIYHAIRQLHCEEGTKLSLRSHPLSTLFSFFVFLVIKGFKVALSPLNSVA